MATIPFCRNSNNLGVKRKLEENFKITLTHANLRQSTQD